MNHLSCSSRRRNPPRKKAQGSLSLCGVQSQQNLPFSRSCVSLKGDSSDSETVAREAFLNSLFCRETAGLSPVPEGRAGRERILEMTKIEFPTSLGGFTSKSASLKKMWYFLHVPVCVVRVICLLRKQLLISPASPLLPSTQSFNSHM